MSLLGFFKDLMIDATWHPIEDLISPGSRTKRRLKKDINKRGLKEDINLSENKFIIFSDIHRGARFKEVDRFKSSEEVYKNALNYYNEKKYNLILLGDIEEGWGSGNRMDRIFESYKDLMRLEKEFIKDKRYYRIYGNHDDYWRKKRGVNRYFNQDPEIEGLNIKVKIYPAIVFTDGNNKILLIHGCQGHNFRDCGDDAARFFVYTKFDALRIKSKKKEFKLRYKMRKQELRILRWAYKKGYLVVMGHTHSIYFGSLPRADFEEYAINMFKDQLEKTTSNEKIKELNENIRLLEDFKNEIESTKDKIQEEFPEISPGVFNAGNCCVFKKAISGIEITDGKINLIFWKEESTAPEVIKTEDLDDLFEKIRGIN